METYGPTEKGQVEPCNDGRQAESRQFQVLLEKELHHGASATRVQVGLPQVASQREPITSPPRTHLPSIPQIKNAFKYSRTKFFDAFDWPSRGG